MKALLRALAFGILLTTKLHAANYDVNPTVRALWPNHNVPLGYDLAVAGPIAYAALGRAGFEILDFSDFASPKSAGTFPQEGFVGGLAVSGDHLFVTDEAAGLHIFDISDRRKPILLSTTTLRGPSCGVAVSGSLAFVTAKHAGVHILDVESPKNPKYKGGYDTPGTALRVAIVENTAYIADFDAGLLALDFANPGAPVALGALTTTLRTMDVAANANYVVAGTLLGAEIIDRRNASRRVNINGRIEDVSISGDYAYLIDNPWAVVAVELPSDGVPRVVGGYPSPGPYNGHAVTGANGLAFAIQNFSIDVINFNNPRSPTLASSFSIDNQVPDGAVVGSHAFVLNQGKLNVVNVSDPDKLFTVGSLALPGELGRIAIFGNVAGVTLRQNGVAFIDISVPSAPRQLSRVALPGDVFAITISANRAYVSGQDTGLHIIDLSDPALPKILGTAPTARIGADTAIYGDYAYLAAHQDGLQIFNIADPAHILSKGVFTNFTGSMRDLEVYGAKLFAATDGGLQVFALSDPAKPQLIADDKMLTTAISIFGDTAYVSGYGMRIVNIADPAHPVMELQTAGIGGKVAGLSGSLAYIFSGAMQIVDFVANPQRMTRFPNIGVATNITVKGKYAYLAGNSEGLRIVDVSHSANPRVVGRQSEPADAVEIRGNRAYIVGTNGFRIVDVSKADEPKTIGSVQSQPMIDVAVAGKSAYSIIRTNYYMYSLAAIDCSNPAAPSIAKVLPVMGSALAVDDHFLYVTDYGVRIFDVSDPLNPQQVGLYNSLGTAQADDIVVRGKYAYLAGGWFGFWVIDISDPANPWPVGRPSFLQTVIPVRAAISGDYAYTYDTLGSLDVFNIERAGRPERVGGNVQLKAASLFASNDTLYISERDGALTILDLFRRDARSLRLTGLEPVIEGAVRLRANAPAGELVQIEKLQDGVWKTLTPLTTDNSPVDFVDPEGSATVQLYRIVKP